MRFGSLRFVVFMAPALFIALPTSAHHSFAIFDQNQLITRTGTVNDFEWINPHVWLHLDIADESGAVASWAFEGGSTGGLASLGWSPELFPEGAEITIGFRPMKDGSRGGQVMSVTLPDGRMICSNRGCG
jgi:hypothetical protein